MQPEKKQGSNRGEVGKKHFCEQTAKSREGTGKGITNGVREGEQGRTRKEQGCNRKGAEGAGKKQNREETGKRKEVTWESR